MGMVARLHGRAVAWKVTCRPSTSRMNPYPPWALFRGRAQRSLAEFAGCLLPVQQCSTCGLVKALLKGGCSKFEGLRSMPGGQDCMLTDWAALWQTHTNGTALLSPCRPCMPQHVHMPARACRQPHAGRAWYLHGGWVLVHARLSPSLSCTGQLPAVHEHDCTSWPGLQQRSVTCRTILEGNCCLFLRIGSMVLAWVGLKSG
jgi:hypothetical protein